MTDVLTPRPPDVAADPDLARQNLQAELADDPSLTLASLAPEDQRRVTLRFVDVTHTGRYKQQEAAAVGEVGYCLFEGTVPPGMAGDSEAIDLAINEQARSDQIADDDLVAISPFLRGYTDQAKANGWATPIFRRIDVFHNDRPDASSPTYGELNADINNRSRVLFKGLFTEESTTQRTALAELLRVRAFVNRPREQDQFDRISVIAANAAMRHPEDNVVIAVVVGTHHHVVADALVDGTAVQHTKQFVPESYRQLVEVGLFALERQLMAGQEPTDEQLDRALLGIVIEQALQTGANALNITPQVAQFIERLGYDRVIECLKGVDAAKTPLPAKPGLLRSLLRRFVHAPEVSTSGESDKAAELRVAQYLSAQSDIKQFLIELHTRSAIAGLQ